LPRKKNYTATRGLSWRKGEGWVDRNVGDSVNDAPADALKEWLALGYVEVAGG